MRALLRLGRLASLVALVLAALGSGTARADSLNLRYVPNYRLTSTSAAGADGVTTSSEGQNFDQRFLLNLEKGLFPALTWSAGGVLDWNKSWLHDDAGVFTNTDSRRWAGNTRLDLGTETLRSSLGYNRNQTDAEITRSAVTTRADSPVTETYSLSVLWRPTDLPRAALSLSRQDSHDAGGRTIDRTTNSASFVLDYDGFETWQLHYAYQLANPVDRLRESDTLSQTHFARVGWADQYLDKRLTTYATYGFGVVSTRTTSGALGGVRETARLPSAGLSRIEAFPDVPTRVTLGPNPALVDSDLTSGAGIDLGHGRSTAGDVALRDLGAQFPEDRPELNTILVSVDRPLTAPVVNAFAWVAYIGDDNLTWTRVPVIGVPVFGIIQNRFEITIERTRARYVKVVVRPLPTAVTTDPLYAEILVTELQFSLVEPLPPGTVRTRDVSGGLTGGLRYRLLREPSLTYDMAFVLSHRERLTPERGSLQHSVGLIRLLDPHTQLSARVARTDSFDPSNHTGQNAWGASLNSEPLPVLGWNLNYGGAYTSSPEGTQLSNALSAGARADLYQGVSSSASTGYALNSTNARQVQAATAAAGLTVTPHRALTATGTFGWLYTEASGGAQSAQRSRSGRIDGSVTFNPIPALYLAAAGGRNIFGVAPATQTSVNAGLSLFQGGGLAIRLSFIQTNDSQTETRGRTLGAGLTWTIARGRTLSVAYNHLATRSPVQRLDIDTASATLQLPAF